MRVRQFWLPQKDYMRAARIVLAKKTKDHYRMTMFVILGSSRVYPGKGIGALSAHQDPAVVR